MVTTDFDTWTHIFDHVTLSHMWARPRIITRFLTAIDAARMPASEAACRILLPLELRAWTSAWRLGVITKSIRAAALKQNLTMRLMRSRFRAPLPEFPLHMSEQFSALPLLRQPGTFTTLAQHPRSILIELTTSPFILHRLALLQADIDAHTRPFPPHPRHAARIPLQQNARPDRDGHLVPTRGLLKLHG